MSMCCGKEEGKEGGKEVNVRWSREQTGKEHLDFR